jgi:hypothetical protein
MRQIARSEDEIGERLNRAWGRVLHSRVPGLGSIAGETVDRGRGTDREQPQGDVRRP